MKSVHRYFCKLEEFPFAQLFLGSDKVGKKSNENTGDFVVSTF